MAGSDSACLHYFSMSISHDPFNPPCILLPYNLVFYLLHLQGDMTPAWTRVLYASDSEVGCGFVHDCSYMCTEAMWSCPGAIPVGCCVEALVGKNVLYNCNPEAQKHPFRVDFNVVKTKHFCLFVF